jgi:hypothetical protein
MLLIQACLDSAVIIIYTVSSLDLMLPLCALILGLMKVCELGVVLGEAKGMEASLIKNFTLRTRRATK